jgi:group I intron endonuclease
VSSGVYAVIHVKSGQRYIGSSKNIAERLASHKRNLTKGNHSNRHLQRAWTKYGSASFVFVVVEKTTIENLLKREQLYMNKFRKKGLFNSRLTAASVLGSVSKETRALLSAAGTKQAMVPARRRQQSQIAKRLWQNPLFRKIFSAKRKRFLAPLWKDPIWKAATIARLHGPKQRAAQARLARRMWREGKMEGVRKLLKKRAKDPKFQAARRRSEERRWRDPEKRKQQSEALKRFWQDPEKREKRSKMLRRLWRNPQYRERMVLAHEHLKVKKGQ